MPGGRPTKYKEEYCDAIVEYFNAPLKEVKVKTVASGGKAVEVEEEESPELPTFERFAHSIGVHVDTLHEWKTRHVEFSEAYKKAQQLQESLIVTNGIKGRYDRVFSMFMLKCNHGYKEQEKKDDAKNSITLNYNIPEKE